MVVVLSSTSTCISGFIIHNTIHNENLGTKIKALGVLRTVIIFICFNADGIIQIINRGHFTSAFKYIQVYDNYANFKQSSRKKTIHFFQLTKIFILFFWIIMLSLCYSTTKGTFRENINVIYGPAISVQILNFSSLIIEMNDRFNHLNKLILETGN